MKSVSLAPEEWEIVAKAVAIVADNTQGNRLREILRKINRQTND